MAYNSGYNPDALPAHAEPEQAAQILAQQQQQQQQQQPPPSQNPPLPHRPRPGSLSNSQGYNTTPQASYQNRPPPLTPQPPPSQQQQRYQQQQPPPRPSPSNLPQDYNYNYNNNQPHPAGPPQNYQAPAPPPQPQAFTATTTSPPPPQNYGFGPPPQAHHGRSPPLSRPPRTPAPPPPGGRSEADASLFPLFKAVDKQGTGQLTEKELRAALVNGDYTSFDLHTVKMMIRMFDVDKTGTINFDEFCGLWSFLAAWRALFDRFDADRSGSISPDEYAHALVAFGYRLSSAFVGILYRTYEKSGEGNMSFDLFVQSCISLKRMTDVFKRYDTDRDGYITLSFEEFLTEILRQR